MNTRGRESGFTLMELVVAMGLTVAALGITVAALNALSGMRETTELLTDGNLALRTSLNVMTRDLIVAGREIPVNGISVPSGRGANPIVRPIPPGAPAGTPLVFPAAMVKIPPVIAGDGLGPSANGSPDSAVNPRTDIITVLAVDDTTPVCNTTTLDTANLMGIAANGQSVTVDPVTTIVCTGGGIKPGDLIMILIPPSASSLQMVTAVVGQTITFGNTDPMQLNQNGIAPSGTLVSLSDGMGNYPPNGRAFLVNMVSYYIDQPVNATRPQLMRRRNMDAPTALGIGIENLQFSYDLTVAPPNVNIPMPANPNTVRKINMFVSGRSRRPLARTQKFLRTSMATQVSLRSLSLVDRYNP